MNSDYGSYGQSPYIPDQPSIQETTKKTPPQKPPKPARLQAKSVSIPQSNISGKVESDTETKVQNVAQSLPSVTDEAKSKVSLKSFLQKVQKWGMKTSDTLEKAKSTFKNLMPKKQEQEIKADVVSGKKGEKSELKEEEKLLLNTIRHLNDAGEKLDREISSNFKMILGQMDRTILMLVGSGTGTNTTELVDARRFLAENFDIFAAHPKISDSDNPILKFSNKLPNDIKTKFYTEPRSGKQTLLEVINNSDKLLVKKNEIPQTKTKTTELYQKLQIAHDNVKARKGTQQELDKARTTFVTHCQSIQKPKV